MSLERLTLELESGFFPEGFRKIPYKIWYTLNSETNDYVDENNPGAYAITPDYPGPGESLSIFVHESVPREFKEVVLYHELEEARLVHGPSQMNTDKEREIAHKRASAYDEIYVRRHLPQFSLEYYKWKKDKEI